MRSDLALAVCWLEPEIVRQCGTAAYVVITYLAMCANKETGKCYPSRTTIANALGLGISTVKRALAELQRAGFLTWEKGAAGRANTYAFPFKHQYFDGGANTSLKCGSAKPANVDPGNCAPDLSYDELYS